MASRKAKSLVFRSPAGVRVAAIRDVIEKDLGSGGVTVVQELQSGEYLIELQNKDQAEQLISDGFGINDLHVQPSPPQGQFTNVSIMNLRAYIEDTSIIKELEKFGEIKSEVIRLKYKKGHDLAGVENGNRLLRMVLTKPSVPYSLKIEGEWCRVIHTNQKPICSLCHEDGHRRNECPTVVCFTCNETGHVRENCPNRPTDNTTPTATEIDEEERRMHTEKLLRLKPIVFCATATTSQTLYTPRNSTRNFSTLKMTQKTPQMTPTWNKTKLLHTTTTRRKKTSTNQAPKG